MYGIDPMGVKIEKQRELGREISKDEEEDLIKSEIKRVTMPGSNERPYLSRIISEDGLIKAVEEGWEIVRELKDSKFLVRRSNHITQ